MVTRYKFFQLLSTIKVKLVDEMMQSAYLSVILHVKQKKLPFIVVVISVKSKMATIVGYVTALQQRHHP